MKYFLIIPFLFLSFFDVTFAQINLDKGTVEDTGGGGLVPCDGPDCNFCHAVVLADKIVDWLIALAVIIAIISLVIAGFRLVMSKGNPGAMDKAKQLIINIFIGILLIMAAWTIVDTVMKLLINESVMGDGAGATYGPWYDPDESLCGGQNEVGKISKETVKLEVVENKVAANDMDDLNEIVDAPGAVDTSTIAGYSGGRGSLPVIAQYEGSITYENNVRLKAYTLNTASAPYDYKSVCPNVTPPKFFKLSESGGVRISKYYKVCDLTNCDASQRAGEYIYLDPRAVAGMDRVAAAMGGAPQVNSGYRSPSYNKGLKGAAKCSQHMAGKAFDIQATAKFPPSAIAKICEEAGAGFTKLYSTFTHCDWR